MENLKNWVVCHEFLYLLKSWLLQKSIQFNEGLLKRKFLVCKLIATLKNYLKIFFPH